MTERTATTSVPHPSTYMREELAARGWTWDDLATAMMRSDDDQWSVHRLAIDLYFIAGPTDTRLRLGAGVEAFARAFGVSREFFVNLEARWLAQGEPGDHACDDDCRCTDEA